MGAHLVSWNRKKRTQTQRILTAIENLLVTVTTTADLLQTRDLRTERGAAVAKVVLLRKLTTIRQLRRITNHQGPDTRPPKRIQRTVNATVSVLGGLWTSLSHAVTPLPPVKDKSAELLNDQVVWFTVLWGKQCLEAESDTICTLEGES